MTAAKMTAATYTNNLRRMANAEMIAQRAARRNAAVRYSSHTVAYAATVDGRAADADSLGCQCSLCDRHAATVAKLAGFPYRKLYFVRNAPAGEPTNSVEFIERIAAEESQRLCRELGGTSSFAVAATATVAATAAGTIAYELKIEW